MANTMTVDQVSTVLRDVLKVATGQDYSSVLNINDLLTIGKKGLGALGVDPILGAMTQVFAKTIFSIRNYDPKFKSIRATPERYGNAVRKIVPLLTDTMLKDNPYLDLQEGQSIDQYKVVKPKVLQLNFLGQQTYEFTRTIFDNQFDTAFNSADEVGRFMSMLFTQLYNEIAKTDEEYARATLAGAVAGVVAADNKAVTTGQVVHLLTEYNAVTGLSLTKADVYKPENFTPFMRWVYGRMATVSDLLTEYSVVNHTNLSDGKIERHTGKDFQRLFITSGINHMSTAQVLSDTYHDNYLKLPGAEFINFWQDIRHPQSITLKSPNYLDKSGSIVAYTAGDSANVLKIDDMFGFIFDEEALGYSPILHRTKMSPYNAEGEYRNIFVKMNERHWVDFTENMVVFVLD